MQLPCAASYNATFPIVTYGFSDRARRGRAKKYSDLDLAVMGEQPLSFTTMASLTDAFSDSDLPYRVDILDWAATSPTFQRNPSKRI